VRGKPSSTNPSRAPSSAPKTQAEHQIVRDKITVSHDRPYLLAERRAEPLLFPQQVTGGDVRHAQVVGEPGALSAFAGSRRGQKQHAHGRSLVQPT
jgi:hypothetical protein